MVACHALWRRALQIDEAQRDRLIQALTVNVALSSDAAHGGGRLLGIFQGRVHRLEREEGCATVHPSTMMHAVSRMTHGARYALIVFFGRNRELMRFNSQVQEALSTGRRAQ